MNKLLIFLVLIAIGLGTLCAVQWRRRAALEPQLVKARRELEAQTRRLEELEAAQQRADQQKREMLRLTDQLGAEIRAQHTAAQATAATNATLASARTNRDPAGSNAGGLGGMLSKMMSDPEMKKFIRDQQRVMVDQLYQPLVKRMGLSAEEAASFKELLADKMMKGTETATSLLGNQSGTNRTELAATIAAEQQSADEQIRAFLGEERYSIYKDYDETAGERAQLNMFRQQSDAGENPLNEGQVEQLLALMRDEKRNTAAAMGQTFAGREQTTMEAVFSGEGSDKLLEAQEASNQRVFERARSVLSPGQLQAFGNFQTNQMQMMRMGMSMARKMMAPGGSGTGQPGQ